MIDCSTYQLRANVMSWNAPAYFDLLHKRGENQITRERCCACIAPQAYGPSGEKELQTLKESHFIVSCPICYTLQSPM